MAQVTSYTAARMKEIEDSAIIDGDIVGDNLILTRYDGTTINAGNVRGPQGPQGSSTDNAIRIVTSTTRPSNPYTGLFIYETDTNRVFSWNGGAWIYRGGVILATSTSRPSNPFVGLSIYETDTNMSFTWNGSAWVNNNPSSMRAKVKRTTAQSIPFAVVWDIVWTVEEFDTAGIWDPTNPARLTIPANGAGLWRFTFNAQFTPASGGGRNFGIWYNNASVATHSMAGSADYYVGSTVSVELSLAVGEYITAWVYQSRGEGGALNIDPVYAVSLSATKIT